MSTTAFKFCPGCGTARRVAARFCPACGTAFPDSEPTPKVAPSPPASTPAPAKPPAPATKQPWQVAVGDTLPAAAQLFALPALAGSQPPTLVPEAAPPAETGKSLWGSTLWMAVTQGADLFARALESGAPNDPNLPLRLGLSAAVTVFSLSLGPLPRLRSIVVRLGTLAMGLLQGQTALPLIKQAIADPTLLQSLAPTLGVHIVGFLALFKLFRAATASNPSIR